jgi:adenosine kinase
MTIDLPSLASIIDPLLDITKEVNLDVLEKYGLKANNAILAEDKHTSLYSELVAMGAEYTAGGATQNSIRVAQWMLSKDSKATSFMGAVGTDGFAESMTKGAIADGVTVNYMANPDLPTGTCAVLITGKSRSLVANLSAANTYKVDHLKENWAIVEAAKIYYISGFFLTVSLDSMVAIGKHALAEGKTFACNLSAPFLIEVAPFFEAMNRVLPYTSIYFGNETEAVTLAKAMGWKTEDVSEIAVLLAKADNKSSRPRTVVFTQGAAPTIVAIADSDRVWSVEEYPVIPIANDDIVDTNGAGDAFVGGFLAGLAVGVSTKQCVARGNYAANVVIGQSGCTYPVKHSFSE